MKESFINKVVMLIQIILLSNAWFFFQSSIIYIVTSKTDLGEGWFYRAVASVMFTGLFGVVFILNQIRKNQIRK